MTATALPRPAVGPAGDNQTSAATDIDLPLVVDADGTLLRTDLLHESLLLLIWQRPWCLLLLPFWLLRGKAAFKREIARRVSLDVETMPVHAGLLEWLTAQHATGRRLALFSASDQLLIEPLARRFGIFDLAIGSDGTNNLKGRAKHAAICDRLGPRFAYVGDSRHDVAIWSECGVAVLAGDTARLQRRLPASVRVAGRFDATRVGPAGLLRALRLHQWSKNLLVVVPLLLSGKVGDPELLLASLRAFLAFGLLASGSYLVNDLFDLAADRRHRSKRHRPFASGDLPIAAGIVAVPLIFAGVTALAVTLPPSFAAAAGLYLAVTTAYTARLKLVPILDMLVLAFLFTLRLLAGIAAVGTAVSPWLLTFSMLFFLSLACIKRYTECRGAEAAALLPGRGYRAGDAPWLMAMGAAAGFSSTIVFFLYLVDPASPMQQYPTPEWLWPICAILAYWLCRTWLLAVRGEMDDDPVLFAVRDRASLWLGALSVLAVVLAHF